MHKLGRLLGLATLIFCGLMQVATAATDNAAEFPGRKLYPDVKITTLKQLEAERDKVIIIDARSRYEYDTLHIRGALNYPVGEPGFVDHLTKLRETQHQPIVFYCNGKTCMKSYQATRKAQDNHIANVSAFDAGVFVWAHAHPDQTALFGKAPLDPKRLIGKAQFDKHLLDPHDFMVKARSGIILDVRDRYQQDAVALFPMQQHSVPMDNSKLKVYVDQAKRQGKGLYIYDAVGKQVEWLQYFLESEGVKNYYFMKGGARAYYNSMLKKL